jgi:receptor expression-enhancing protein 5/6
MDIETVKAKIDSWSEALESYPVVPTLAKKVGVPNFYVAVVLALIFIIIGVMGYGANFICDIVGTVPPSYLSFKAIRSDSREAVKMWMSYWVVYTLFKLLERIFTSAFYWIPLYPIVKFAFIIAL